MAEQRGERGERRARGNSIELRAYAGVDPTTGKRHYLTQTVPGTLGKRDLDRRHRELLGRADALAAERRRVRVDGLTPREAIESATPTEVTFGQAAAAWLDDHLDGLEESGRDTPATILRAYVLPTLGDVALWRIRPALTPVEAERFPQLVSLKAMYRALEADGAKRGGPLASGSLQRIHGVVKSVLGFAYARGWATGNAARETRPATHRIRRRELPDDDNFALFLSYLAVEHAAAHLAALLVMSGARPNEVAALRISSVDLERRTLRVGDEGLVLVRGADGKARGKLVRGSDTKKRRVRTIAISTRVTDAIRARLRELATIAEACDAPVRPDAFLFSPDPAGERCYEPGWAGQAFSRWAQRAARKGVAALPETLTIYDCRHYGITSALAAGHRMADVAQRFGTSARMIAATYWHASPGGDAGIADTLDRVLDGGSVRPGARS